MTDKSKGKQLGKSKKAKSNQILGMRGLSVRDIVLPWESKDPFKHLYRELMAELSPHGRMEEDIVFNIAVLQWRKYQLHKMLRTAALKDPFFIQLVQCGRKSWSGVRKHLLEENEPYEIIRGRLANLMSNLSEAAKKMAGQQMAEAREKEHVERTDSRISDITKAMSEHLIPMIQAIDAGPSAERTFDQAYSPESLERVVKCEAAIDSRIDKLLARLVSLKEYKRMYGTNALLPPTIESPATAAEVVELTTDR
jgi:hypothetical protein